MSTFAINKSNTSSNTFVVLDRKKSELITLTPDAIIHMPQNGPSGEPGSARHPILCERFHPAHPNGCMKGNCCNRVHAIVRGAPRKAVHINWAWRFVEECQYERFPAGETIEVREPVSAKSDIVDRVDSGFILKTRCVFNDPNRPPTHCAHFYYGRECHLGDKCDFAHVVHINANADSLERAPPPCAFGRRKKTHNERQPEIPRKDGAARVRVGFHFPARVPQQILTNHTQQPVVTQQPQPQPTACTPPRSMSTQGDVFSPVTPQSNYIDTSRAAALELHRLRRNGDSMWPPASMSQSQYLTLTPPPQEQTYTPTPPPCNTTIEQQHQQNVSFSRWRYDPYNAVTGRSDVMSYCSSSSSNLSGMVDCSEVDDCECCCRSDNGMATTLTPWSQPCSAAATVV